MANTKETQWNLQRFCLRMFCQGLFFYNLTGPLYIPYGFRFSVFLHLYVFPLLFLLFCPISCVSFHFTLLFYYYLGAYLCSKERQKSCGFGWEGKW